jgi:outer membrane protein assembly factor BamB
MGLSALLLLLAAADEWPQWLGPTRDGVTVEKVAPWKEAPKPVWRAAVGEGHSSPIVAGGRAFLHAKVKGKDEEEVIAWEAKTGKEVWRKSYPRPAFASIFGVGPRATPAVSGDRLYTLGVTGILSCWQAADGKQVWQVDTLKEFKAKNLFFGVSCSPLVEGDLVIVNVGGPGASVVAFRKETGEAAWKVLDDKATYSSGIALGKGKERQVIFLTHDGLVGLSPADGTLFWKFPLVDKLAESSTTPVLAGDLLLGSSVTYGSAGLRLEVKDGKPGFTEAWKNPALTCYISTPVAVGTDHLYMVTGTIIPPPSANLHCVDAKTGKILWSRPGVGKYHAALLRTGDGKLLMLEEGGDLVLLDPGPAGYRELARGKICGNTWAHPAVADGTLLVRDARELVCVALAP